MDVPICHCMHCPSDKRGTVHPDCLYLSASLRCHSCRSLSPRRSASVCCSLLCSSPSVQCSFLESFPVRFFGTSELVLLPQLICSISLSSVASGIPGAADSSTIHPKKIHILSNSAPPKGHTHKKHEMKGSGQRCQCLQHHLAQFHQGQDLQPLLLSAQTLQWFSNWTSRGLSGRQRAYNIL